MKTKKYISSLKCLTTIHNKKECEKEQCLEACKHRETEKDVPALTPLYLVHLRLGKKPSTKTN